MKFFSILTFFIYLALPVVTAAEGVTKENSQKKLHTLKLAGKVLKVELAEDENSRRRGLMFRKSLNEDEGMLFIFPDETQLSFWMKNTFIPLDIGFFDKDKRLINFLSMEPVKSEMQVNLPSYESRGPAKFALEVNQGWFKKNKVQVGQKFELERAKP